MKNRILLENNYLPGDLERQLDAFVEDYNNQRYHESLDNVTPADVYFGLDKAILREREKIKKQTIQNRRLQHKKASSIIKPQSDQSLHASSCSRVPNYLTMDMFRRVRLICKDYERFSLPAGEGVKHLPMNLAVRNLQSQGSALFIYSCANLIRATAALASDTFRQFPFLIQPRRGGP